MPIMLKYQKTTPLNGNLSLLLLAFLPSNVADQSSKRFLPGVHLDDSNSRHHLVHGADPAVSQDRRLTSEGNRKKKKGI